MNCHIVTIVRTILAYSFGTSLFVCIFIAVLGVGGGSGQTNPMYTFGSQRTTFESWFSPSVGSGVAGLHN